MKKLKLSRSKACDEKQRKIISFFTSTKQVTSNIGDDQEKGKDCTVLNTTPKDEGISKDPSHRPFGGNRCIKCLEKSPKSGTQYCNNCNFSTEKQINVSVLNSKVNTGSIKPFSQKGASIFVLSDAKNSPDIDVIPPTPPTVDKKRKLNKLSEKCAKKKCNFNKPETVKTVLKTGLSNIPQPSEHKLEPLGTSKGDMCLSSEKENSKLITNRNPVCETTFKTKIEDYPVDSVSVVKAIDGKRIINKNVVRLLEHTDSVLSSKSNSNIDNFTEEVHTNCNLNIEIDAANSIKLNGNVSPNETSGCSRKIELDDDIDNTEDCDLFVAPKQKHYTPSKNKASNNKLTLKVPEVVCINEANLNDKIEPSVCRNENDEDQPSLFGNLNSNVKPSLLKDVNGQPLLSKHVDSKDQSSIFVNLNRKEDSLLCEDLSDKNQPLSEHVDPKDQLSPLNVKDKDLLPSEQIGKSHTDLISSDMEDSFDASFLDNISFDESTFKEPLSLERSVRCTVTSVNHLQSSGEVVLALQSSGPSAGEVATCVLRGSWATTSVREGDTVSVSARPLSGQAGCWVVDDDTGLLTTHPDTLVSGTTIVGSLFCMRRSVLSDMYRGVDSDSSIMVIGSFLHELLQEVLKRKVSSLEGIKEVLNSFVSSRHFIFSLYSSGMTLEKTRETLFEFVPKIYAFVEKYITPNNRNMPKENYWNDKDSWRGKIINIADIEENVWAPRLGVKGKIDVTVRTLNRNKEKVMPLELKTGRASFSAEHRGQVILYTMMMSELGPAVDSGLLLYLREEVMKEVEVGAAERRDLVMLRNQLVTELRASQDVVVTSSQQIEAPVLPPPIHHHSACAKCPYLTLCSAALRLSGTEKLSETNPLHGLSVSSTEHLQPQHIMYVFHWTGLLRLEHTDTHLRSPALHNIWTLPPAHRKKRGTCMPGVKLLGTVTELAGTYEHVFEWNGDAEAALGWVEGDYVIVSSDTRPAVAAGPIRHISLDHLTLHLERDLSGSQKGEGVWHLDKYESQSGLMFNMTNLGCLLDNTVQADRLRRAVIDLELPEFKPKLSSRVLKASVDLLAPLNDQQRKAIFRALAADHYILIKGMPGTGKTATIAALIQLAVRLGLSVLITSHTHSAVDNVLLRLRGKVDFLRLGSAHKVHPELAEYTEAGCTFTSPQDIQDFYNSKSVVAVTCLGSSHPLLSRRQFDMCLVDEATQVLQPTVLRPLFSANKFILIGDPNQLPPLVRSSQPKKLGLDQSLFVRLDRPAVTSELSLQYRMNQCITRLANTLTYQGKLQCADPAVSSATLNLPTPLGGQPEWMKRALSACLDLSVVVLDTGVTRAVDCTNHVEADVVIEILIALRKAGVADECVGVIAPYRAQVELLRNRSRALPSCVEVNTVDQYQGRDKSVIIYSCTRSSKPKETDILSDKNRLTVAVTRARHKLIIVGGVTFLHSYSLFNTLFTSLSDQCIVQMS